MIIKDRQKSRRVTIVLCVICALLQLMLSPNFALFNGRINFMLILAVCIAIRDGGERSVWFGFAAGLFFDLTSTGPIGLMALLLTVSCFLIGGQERNRISNGWNRALRLFAVTAAAVGLVYQIGILVYAGSLDLFDALILRFLPTLVLNCIAFLPFLAYLIHEASSGSSLSGVQGTKMKRSQLSKKAPRGL
jgi:rod shape-determining protein MreD